MPLAGVLPFGSIFIEMYFIMTSMWGYMYFYVYGFVLLVYAILVVVLVCTTIVAVYFVLNGEVNRARARVAVIFCLCFTAKRHAHLYTFGGRCQHRGNQEIVLRT